MLNEYQYRLANNESNVHIKQNKYILKIDLNFEMNLVLKYLSIFFSSSLFLRCLLGISPDGSKCGGCIKRQCNRKTAAFDAVWPTSSGFKCGVTSAHSHAQGWPAPGGKCRVVNTGIYR